MKNIVANKCKDPSKSVVVLGFFFVIVSLVSCVCSATEVNVDVLALQNNSKLRSEEVDVLNELVLSLFAEIPGETINVHGFTESKNDECDDNCFLAAAKRRHAKYVVFGSLSEFGSGYLLLFKLVDIHSKKPIAVVDSGPCPTADALIPAVRQATDKLKERLLEATALLDPTASTPAKDDTATARLGTEKRSLEVLPALSGRLEIITEPPVAHIYLSTSHRGDAVEFIGVTPLQKELYPNEYRLIVTHRGRKTVRTGVRINPGEQKRAILTLDYKPAPHKIWGHAAFWTGLAVSSAGIVGTIRAFQSAQLFADHAKKDDETASRTWASVMWAGYGVALGLMTVGIVLWVISPGSQRYWEQKQDAVSLSRKEKQMKEPPAWGGAH